MKRLKTTTRALMLGVLGIALILGLAIPAHRTMTNPERHYHTGFEFLPIELAHGRRVPMGAWQQLTTPFAAQYWREITGLARPERRDCGETLGFIEEVCSMGHPEIIPVPYDYTFRTNSIPAQQAEWERLRKMHP